MTIPELIQQAGDKVQWQWLAEAFVGAQKTKKGTQITFGTRAVTAMELATGDEKYVGIVVWIPKDKMPELP